MAQSAKDIRINELLDANSQLNTTVKHLVDALTQKDKALADMQARLDEMTEELKLLRNKPIIIQYRYSSVHQRNTCQILM